MKWLNEVLDEVAKVLIKIGEGLLLACLVAALLGKIESACILISVCFSSLVVILLGLYLTRLHRQKEEKKK